MTAEDDLSEIKSDLEAVRMNLHLSNNRNKNNSDKIKDILERMENMGNTPAPVAAPAPVVPVEIPKGGEIDVNQLSSMFASLGALQNLEKRVSQCEAKESSLLTKADNHQGRIEALEAKFDQMDKQMNSKFSSLEDMIGSLSTPAPVSSDGNVDLSQFTMQISKL